MTNEQLRMQMLAGVITEGEYRAVINKEIIEEDKTSLNESMIGGIVGIGAINQIPPRAKADYEMAFEHFLGERYDVEKTDNPNQDLGKDNEGYKNTLQDIIAAGEKQLVDLEQLKGKVKNIDSSIAKAKEVIDGLKASFGGTNEGKEESLKEADNLESLQNALRKEIETILYGYVADIYKARGIYEDELESVAGDIVDYIMVGLNDIAGSSK